MGYNGPWLESLFPHLIRYDPRQLIVPGFCQLIKPLGPMQFCIVDLERLQSAGMPLSEFISFSGTDKGGEFVKDCRHFKLTEESCLFVPYGSIAIPTVTTKHEVKLSDSAHAYVEPIQNKEWCAKVPAALWDLIFKWNIDAAKKNAATSDSWTRFTPFLQAHARA